MGVGVESFGGTRVLTLGWPEKRNSLAPPDAREITAAITAVASDAGARVLVLTGDGAFCSGGDLRAFARISGELPPAQIRSHVYGDIQAMIRALRDLPLPTVAAVDGAAVGLGMDLALACDMRFIGPAGWLRQGWATAGLISATAGSWFVEHAAPGTLWSLLAAQPRLDAAACVALRLGDEGEPSGLAAAKARAEALASIPTDTLAAYVDLFRTQRWPSDSYLERCADYQAEFIGSERFRALTAQLLQVKS
jgi:enoyl-CoA hydratase/carnithine racemase